MSSSFRSSNDDENVIATSKSEKNDEQSGEELRSLTNLEVWNMTFSLLAWACTVSNLTLGTSASERREREKDRE